MTNQERPVEERNELQDDLETAATVAVDEPGTSGQEQPAVDEQPVSAAQPIAAPPVEATQAAETPAAAESATPVATVSADPEPTASQEAIDPMSPVAAASAEPVARQEPAPALPPINPVTLTSDEPVAPQEPATPTAAAEPVDVASAEPQAAGQEPAPALPPINPVTLASAEPEPVAEGASYTPVAEDESGKPRRVKDLEPGMELEGRVTSIALYGIFVDIGVGRDGLVHISEMSDTRIDSPSDVVQIGDTVKVRVKSVEPDGRRISLTMRSKERGAEARGGRGGRKKPELNREALAALRVGDNIEGTVTGIAPFGVFVDIGVGKDGLVHVSELAEGRVDKPEDAVQVGQTYTFKLLEVDADGTRISLSLRRAQRGQRQQQEESQTLRLQELEKGQIYEGTISGLAPFGAFVDIGVGRDGLIHISELSEGRVAKVEDAVKVGEKVTVRVLDIDPASKRISLTLRLEDRPREEPTQRGNASAEPRGDRGRREERGPRGPRQNEAAREAVPEVYTSAEEPEEPFAGNATLEDLVSKFGSKRDRKRRQDEEEEDGGDRFLRRQRDAIRRTLQQMNDDE